MEDNNNFFGFVSKIGSLINTNKNQDKETKKKGQQKKYNIKISTDDEEGLDNIDNISDEEEEEEEEEEEKKDEEKNQEETKKQEEENIEKEKIKKIVKEIMDNNDNNKDNNEDDNDIENNEEEEKEDIEDNINIINNSSSNSNNNAGNINDNKILMCPPILNNSFPTLNINPKNSNQTFFYDETTSCHIMLKKGNDFSINDYIVFPILFMEKHKNIFYKIGMMNNPTYEPKNYLFFFDEHYLYFAKDEIIVEEMDEDTRRIRKIISLFDIKDFSTDNDKENNEKFLIKLLIKKEDDKEKEINFYVEEKYFAGFIKNFNLKLSIYGIDFFSNKKN